jgi:peroxiredoxin Q/BCP
LTGERLDPNPRIVKRTTRRSFAALALVALLAVGASSGCASATTRPDGGEGMLAVGASAPDVARVDDAGKPRKLSEERGHPVLVYFYPKDGTPGCTVEACAIRDRWKDFESAGLRVIGVSAQDAASHAEFAKKERLPFPLVADTDLTWARAFGVGSFLGMTSRVSFLLDREGRVAKVYPDVVPAQHAADVLADAKALP